MPKAKLPKDMSDARLYKQAGNSVCVSVIKRIADERAEVPTPPLTAAYIPQVSVRPSS